MRCLCFATGNLYRLLGKRDVIDLISRLDVDGVELTLGRRINERPVRKSDLPFLRSLKYVSIHSPFSLSLDILKRAEFESVYSEVVRISRQVNAKNIVFHPGKPMPKDFFSRRDFTFLIENMHKKPLRDKMEFEQVLNEYPNSMMCLDAMHACTWSKDECEEIVNKWGKRIAQVHFSNYFNKQKHVTFERVSKGFLESIEPLLGLDVPMVIEEDMPYAKISEIRAEVRRVKNILGF